MLTYESLIDQAKQRGMPTTKMRGILREYLEILILKELGKTEEGRKLYFTGGTYLRLAHNLKRFSEDLDFNTAHLKKSEFEEVLRQTKLELNRLGIQTEVEFTHWENLLVGRFIFKQIEEAYNISSKFSKKSGLLIKVETHQPVWKITTETEVISGFGEFFPCVCTAKGHLFADKVDALVKKNRARHLYDIIFMLSHRWPIQGETLKALGIQKDPLPIILKRVQSFTAAELKKWATELQPFLFDESETNFILNAHEIVPSLIEKYRPL